MIHSKKRRSMSLIDKIHVPNVRLESKLMDLDLCHYQIALKVLSEDLEHSTERLL